MRQKQVSTAHSRERLFLLDGMALAYRAYFSFITRPLVNSKGENTSAIFGFINTLMKILSEEKPEHIAVVFDTREPTFRHKMYEPYKATREKMPEEMSAQMDKLKEVVEAFNVPLLELPGFEADDIMGTLARKAEREGIETFLVTGDKDFMQLLSPLVKMFKPGKQGDEWETLDVASVRTKFGVAPDHVIDVLGLTGDTSDNVPGIPGIGEKTAIPLIQKYGTIENLLDNIDAIPQKGIQQKLREHKEKALLSKSLVTIETSVPIKADIHHLEAKPRDNSKLLKLFAELEFKSLLKKLSDTIVQVDSTAKVELPETALDNIVNDKHTYHLVATEKEFDELVSKLKHSKLFVFDTETTGRDPLLAELVGLSFALRPREAWYVPVQPGSKQYALRVEPKLNRPKRGSESLFPKSDHLGQTWSVQGLAPNHVLTTLAPVFSNESTKKIGQNIKYDMLVLAAHGIETRGVLFDTMVANYVLRPDGQHNLDALAVEHLRYKMISYDELTGTGKNHKELRDIRVEEVADYSAQDADITFRLSETLTGKLEQQQLIKLCEEIEFPLIPVLADMERTGVTLDLTFLRKLSKELSHTLENLTRDIYAFAGEPFNVNSTQQLGKILFDKMKLSVIRKTKTGFSTDVGVLETLRHEHPIVEKLLEYRQMQKLKSTYVDALPELMNPTTDRLHTSFNQTVAATGRLSSSDPNLQNIPIRSDIGRSIRKAFIPADAHHCILSADYSQIELRIMAHISGDEAMRQAFQEGEDIHATTASKVFGLPAADVTRDMRRKAKEVNFGIMYGIGPFGLANRLDISQSEAKVIITKYFERFPKVNQYIFDTIARTKQAGFVTTLLGRRRYLPDINSRNGNIRSNAERQAINMPIQGTAADMIKLAMIGIHTALGKKQLHANMLLQVHDELVFEVAKNDERETKKLVIEKMKTALPLSVPVEVEAGSGENWFEAH